MARADPVFRTPPPAVGSLSVGATVRLYGKSNTLCIGEGIVREYTGTCWGITKIVIHSTSRTRAAAAADKRTVVEVTTIHKPDAYLRHPCQDGQRRTLGDVALGQLALWELVSDVAASSITAPFPSHLKLNAMPINTF
jgi:hypothetical protein